LSQLAVIDTSIYLNHFRHGKYREELQKGIFLVRNSSVVLAELYRGCHEPEEREHIDELAENFPVITPPEKIWLESGKILAQLAKQKGYQPGKIRDLHFDVLIALSARSVGAVLITNNRRDFEEVKKLKDFKLLCWD